MSSSDSSEEEQTDDSEEGNPEPPPSPTKKLSCPAGVPRAANGSTPSGHGSTPSGPSQQPNGRKPSLGHATSLPLPKRSGEAVTQQKSLTRCPTVQARSREGATAPAREPREASPSTPEFGEKHAVGPKEPARRKESITWSPFAALGKAVGSGVDMVGKTTKAVGEGVVQGTKAVGTGVVTGTKAVSSGVVSAAETVGDGIVTGTKVVGSGVAAVGDGVVSGVAAVGEATVAAGSAVGSAVGEAVDDSASWAKEKRQSVIMHTKKTTVHIVEQDETIGIIAAKYKTTVEQIVRLNKELLEEGDVKAGMEVRVPLADRRKSSKAHRSSSDFLSSLSTQLGLEGEDGESEGADTSAETRCIILSAGGVGPRTVSQGFLILDTESLILSWGREDPVTITKEDLRTISLVYGTLEQPDFHSLLLERQEHSCPHSFSEAEVFPVCDEEPELESLGEESSQGTEEHSPRQLRTQDSDDLSLSGSFKNGSNSFDERPEGGDVREGGEVREGGDVREGGTPDSHGVGAGEERRRTHGRRRSSRKRSSHSRERRASLLFEDTMATYVYVELEASAVPAKITSSVSPSNQELLPAQSSSGSSPGEELMRKSGSFTLQTKPAFLVRVPNETVVRLFSLLMRHYSSHYGVGKCPGEGAGFSRLTMETMHDQSGADIKVGHVLASKNSFCEEENGAVPCLDTASDILEEEDLLALRDRLPTRLENNQWSLAFSTARDGFSLKNLYRMLQSVDSVVLLVIQDTDQVIFGGLLSEPPQVTDSFCGTGECWLFSFQSGQLEVYTWTTANQLFIKGCGSNLVVGASAGDFGLWFDEDLNKGRSQECATFGNPALTPSSDFAVNCMEVWAFQSST